MVREMKMEMEMKVFSFERWKNKLVKGWNLVPVYFHSTSLSRRVEWENNRVIECYY